MKYLKLYENFGDIKSICSKYKIRVYIINQDGSIDVDANVFIQNRNLKKFPLKFGKVNGYFNCEDNRLISLKGSPKEVYGFFSCSENELNTLLDGPLKVGGDYWCYSNPLTDVYGFPEYFDKELFIHGTTVYEIIQLITNEYSIIKFIKWLNEYDVIRPGNKIVEMRLEEAYWMTTKPELPMDKRTFKNYQLI